MMKAILAVFILLLSSTQVFAGETYNRVMKTGTIRCGYPLWTPILFKDANTGEIRGAAYDLMEEAGKRLGLKIEWAEEVAWGTMIEGMTTGRYDMICTPLGRSTARTKFIGFSQPLFYTPLYAVVKMDDTRFDKNIDALNDPAYKIAVLEGELSSITARQIFPKAAISEMPQMQDYSLLLKEIETGKADVTIVEPETFKTYEVNNPGKLKMLKGRPINVFPATFGLPKDDSAFAGMIDTAVGELTNDGSVDRALKRHEKYPEAFLRAAKPYQPAP